MSLVTVLMVVLTALVAWSLASGVDPARATTNDPDFELPNVPGGAEAECAAASAITGITYTGSFKIDPPADGNYPVGDYGTITLDNVVGNSFDWSSTFGIGAVIVKAWTGIERVRVHPAVTRRHGPL